MEIKTKFSIGDSAFVMYDNRVAPITIVGVYYSLNESKDENIIYYAKILINDSIESIERFLEESVFATKEELLKSL